LSILQDYTNAHAGRLSLHDTKSKGPPYWEALPE
jgi:hypothetical protein